MKRISFVLPVATLAVMLIFGCVSTSGQTPAKEESYIHLNKVIDKLERNILVTGIWVNTLHPSTAIGLARVNGYPNYKESLTKPMIDFILIDMEHEPFEMSDLRNFLLALTSRQEVLAKGNLQPNITTLVRIPVDADGPIDSAIKQVLDLGAHGVVVPHVRTAAEAERVVRACRYPQPKDSPIAEPLGRRGAAPRLPSYLWGVGSKEYVRRADVWPLNPKGDLLAVIMIEDQEGVDNLEEILKVKGIGAVFFGPYDFSFSIGLHGSWHVPQVDEGLAKVKKICDRFNVPLIGFAGPRDIEVKLKEDFKMLLIGEDWDLKGDAYSVLAYIKKHNGLTPK